MLFTTYINIYKLKLHINDIGSTLSLVTLKITNTPV